MRWTDGAIVEAIRTCISAAVVRDRNVIAVDAAPAPRPVSEPLDDRRVVFDESADSRPARNLKDILGVRRVRRRVLTGAVLEKSSVAVAATTADAHHAASSDTCAPVRDHEAGDWRLPPDRSSGEQVPPGALR